MTQPRDRVNYSAIIDRPVMKLPGDARIIVWTIVNLEAWDIARPMARQVLSPPTGVTMLPDVPNWSWHEYGMRVAFWRMRKMYERVGDVPNVVFPTAAIPYPEKDELRIYYGGADTVFCLATAKISELIDFARSR